MRVTFVLPGYSPHPVGGVKIVYEHANGLVAKGYEVTVVHPRVQAGPVIRAPRDVAIRGWSILRTLPARVAPPSITWHSIDPRVDLRYVPTLDPVFVPRAEAVVATGWWTAEFVARYPASKGSRFYFIQHHETWSGSSERVDATWRLDLRKIVSSRWLMEKGAELGVPRGDIRLVPYGIDVDVYRVRKPIEDRPPTVAMMYSSLDWKGGAEGVRALELARVERPELEAILFGVDEPPAGLPPWIRYHRNPQVEVLVREVYNRSAVYLCPSWSEGWGLPSAEAMACGCAVVTTPVVGDYAIDEETALFVPPRAPEAMAAGLLQLLDKPGLRVELARNGLEVVHGFTWERATAELERALEDGITGAWKAGSKDQAAGAVPAVEGKGHSRASTREASQGKRPKTDSSP